MKNPAHLHHPFAGHQVAGAAHRRFTSAIRNSTSASTPATIWPTWTTAAPISRCAPTTWCPATRPAVPRPSGGGLQPVLLAPGETEITLADLHRYPLLHEFTTDTWIALLRQNNALKGKYNFSRAFTNFAVMVQSAVAGQGIALVSHAIASEDLRSGVLKMVCCDSAPYERGYRIIVSRSKQGMAKIEHFCDWLREEVAEMQKGLRADAAVLMAALLAATAAAPQRRAADKPPLRYVEKVDDMPAP
jgi:hypothetical protein